MDGRSLLLSIRLLFRLCACFTDTSDDGRSYTISQKYHGLLPSLPMIAQLIEFQAMTLVTE
jgi:hypothetical protein